MEAESRQPGQLAFRHIDFQGKKPAVPDDRRREDPESSIETNDPAARGEFEFVAEVRELLQEHQTLLQERFDSLEEVVVGFVKNRAMGTVGTTSTMVTQAETPLASAAAAALETVRQNIGNPSYGAVRSTRTTDHSNRRSVMRTKSTAKEARASGTGEYISVISKAYGRSGKSVAPERASGVLRRTVHEEEEMETPERHQAPESYMKQKVGVGGEALFEFSSSFMILLNGALMGVETEYMTYSKGMTHMWFIICQLALNLWFTIELLIRMFWDNWRFFTSTEWRWNLFDALLVCFSLADLFNVAQTGLEGGVAGTGRMMRIIRLARVVRILRLCRSLNNIHEFRKMVYSLQASMATLCWALLLLFVVMYAFAVLFVQGVAQFSNESEDSDQLGVLQLHYGSLFSAIITLYKAISNGQSWSVLMDPLEQVDGTFIFLFLTYVSIVFFGVLNVVSAVFVESAMASAQHYKDLRIHESRTAKGELVRHMKDVFATIDQDNSGYISFSEMDEFFNDPQLKMYVESLEITVEDTEMLFKLMDLDDSGTVDIHEFCDGLLRLQGDARSLDVHLLIFESAKFQHKWDRFVSYVETKFNEVTDAFYTTDLCPEPVESPPGLSEEPTPIDSQIEDKTDDG